jgi:hypothetical protein
MPFVFVALMTMWADQNGPAADGFHIWLEGRAQRAIQVALERARARLSLPRCEQMFAEYVDQNGRPLSAKLRSTGSSAADYLAALYFVEADDRQCRADETIAAFTTPGSRVIHVCTARFAERAAPRTRDDEYLVLHELLHVLGLGENPPSPSAITAVVRDRCGK